MTNKHLIDLGEKVSEKQIDQIINDFYLAYSEDNDRNNYYEFNFSNLKWISNQELLVLTGLLQYLIHNDTNLKINFLSNGSSSNIDERIAKQIVQIWEVWKIHQIVPHQDYNKYFDIDGNFVKRIANEFGINSTNQEIYERFGVTPFLSLPKIKKYDDKVVSEILNKVYTLSEATNHILIENQCFLPFENKTLSSIITKELYENFLDHFNDSFLNNQNHSAFLSISLKRRLNQDYFEKKQIQSILKLNFSEENINELKPFFYNTSTKEFKNESLLQISFLDFGEGISTTLFDSFSTQKENLSKHHIDSKILKYAFEPLSSQHIVQDRFSNKITTPRGLFDVISIVKRFGGLAVVRSNYGKIAFDFSENKSFEDAIIHFGDDTLYFPGSLISLYIPERHLEKKFDTTSIKPKFNFNNYNFKKRIKKTVRLFNIQTEIKTSSNSKKNLYNDLFNVLLAELNIETGNSLIYLDFEGYEIDERVSKKIVYFLCSDYRLNYQNNVIVLNPPPKHFLQNIKDEISELEEVDKKFKFHPTPFIYLDAVDNELEIFWLGIYSENDVQKLNNLLFEEHDLRASDFENPDDVIGHINTFDHNGNLFSTINSKEIINFYKEKKELSAKEEIQELIESSIQKKEGSIYLCNGNYYQYEYLLLNEVIYNKDKLRYLSNNLFEKLKNKFGHLNSFLFAGITSSSHKILEILSDQGFIHKENCIYLNNYFSFETEKEFLKLTSVNSKSILICDVLSTGFMVKKFESHLKEHNAELIGIGVLVNGIDKNYQYNNYRNFDNKLVSTFEYKIEKKQRYEISSQLKRKELKVIRINPFTNTPITHSLQETDSDESILLKISEFLNYIDSEHIKIGYFEFNNLIHPYFFDMETILDKSFPTSNKILHILFQKLNQKKNIQNIDLIFYPRESGIKNIDFDYFKNNIIPNHSIEFIQLERFSTNEGWRFSHPPISLKKRCKDKYALILDDGSCSGESLLQMVDEVAFFEVREILVLSIVGRVNDHKKEFFSRLKSLRAGGKTININIYFGCHWHLPTYHLSRSPISEELNWLKKIQTFTNLPLKLRKIVQVVNDELALKPTAKRNSNHLIKSKDRSSNIKDLIFVRNEFGKLSEFRFYIEYFDYLNDFISKYESKSKVLRGKKPYKDIELICGVIVHEPYLFVSLKKIVPDLVEKLKDFIHALFWNKNVIDQNLLTYNWDIKNFIHLIFIVYSEHEIVNVIGLNNLSIFLNKHCLKPSDKDYFFYRILKGLQINNDDKVFKIHSSKFLHLSNELISLIEKDKSQFKTIPSFFASLPNNVEDYYFLLSSISSNYKKLQEDSSHNEYIFNDKQVLTASLKVIEKNNRIGADSTNQIKVIRKSWKEISGFIEALLRFSSGFPNYFIYAQDYLNLEKTNKSLRTLHGEISNEIYNGNFSNISNIQLIINTLFDEFIDDETNYSKLFSNPNNVKLNDWVQTLIGQAQAMNEAFNFEANLNNDIWIEFPQYYFEQIIIKEIIGNMRFALSGQPIKIHIETINDSAILLIENNINLGNSISKGGGKGTARLQRLNLFNGLTSYESNTNGSIYVQKLTFKKI